ncbi:MAG: nucleotide exchange factor GrpE [Candidatus Moranbacteria bacterium]|nr:nucleotide exchange factor GrpE [Candidatus Moranbacteria bacterium]
MTEKKKKIQEEEKNVIEDKEETIAKSTTDSQEKIPEALATEYLNDLRRCQAEFENYKKRQAAQQKELGGYLIEKLVLDIVPVLDNFRQATLHVPPEQKDSPWVVGIQYIEKQLETVLTDNGVSMIEVQEGEVFDPKIHEALDSEQGAENAKQKENDQHMIAKVIQKGYRFGERVIRPAKVVVK